MKISKIKDLSAVLPKIDEVKESTEIIEENDEDLDDIQAPKTKPEKPPKIDRRKREHMTRTPAQEAAFAKARENRDLNRKNRAENRNIAAEEEKRIIEEKVVKKAVSIKKRQIKRNEILDSISDDEADMEEIRAILRRRKEDKLKAVSRPQKKEPNIVIPPSPLFNFG
jgi:hypothetical protein